ncbi:cyclopropane fatty acyl phospholipid synthase [Elongatibacter sediminis]|uniref:Cyclopropane fatty acyl phospholipid synthase n=1 Tax=Elongatibacter sediminis TaxID=3119006 RepID=A0AAW9R7T7_9GAMM
MSKLAKTLVTDVLSRAGISIDGPRPWDIRVNHPRFHGRVLTGGSLGFGEAYMDGDWDVGEIDALFRRLIRSDATRSPLVLLNRLWLDMKSRLTNLQSRRGSRAIAETHYDLDHRLYEQFLGPHNQYTCCFFNRASTLAEAEVEKLEMICDKLGLESGHEVLDIGCGWGGFARYAAETRGCRVTGISISREQVSYARKYTSGLPVNIIEADYRDLNRLFDDRRFDRIVIIGMIEHVGYRNYRRLFGIIHRLLKDEGSFLLHTIGNSHTTTVVDPWIEKYIFRNSMAPSTSQLAAAAEDLFTVHDWENCGHYYAPTLAAWQRNFEANWEKIAAIDAERPFDERFRRMFNYYFLSCKAGFETENILLWHLVMRKKGLSPSVYPRVNLRQTDVANRTESGTIRHSAQ